MRYPTSKGSRKTAACPVATASTMSVATAGVVHHAYAARVAPASLRRRRAAAALPLALAVALAWLAALPAAAAAQSAPGAPSLAPPSAELTPGGIAPLPYGTAVAISGDTAAVTGSTNGLAAVYVFLRTNLGWTEQAKIADPAGRNPASLFGAVLALSGDTLAIGAAAEGAPVSSVYIYVRTAGTWSLQAHLQPPRAAGLGFGAALALSLDTLVVGAPGTGQCDVSGAAYVYARAGETWSRQAILSAKSPAAGDRFGRAVAVARQAVVVGGPGFAEIFELKAATWQRTAILQGSGGAGSSFGDSVAASQETVAVGDPANQLVSIFFRNSAGWFHQVDIAPADPQAGDFGAVISLSQDALAVGAPSTSGTGAAASGAVYVYFHLRHRWLLDGAFGPAAPGAGERFGGAVAISFHTAVVGSTQSDHGVPQTAWLLDDLDNP